MLKHVVRLTSLLTALATPVIAEAATLVFTLTGSRSAVFRLDSMPTPDSFTSLQTNFLNVAGSFGGTQGIASLINFGRSDGVFSAAALNIQAPGLGFTQFSGPEIFSGTTANPIFAPGVFNLNNPFFGGPATLTIAALGEGGGGGDGGGGGMEGGGGSEVPEPATWALLVIGFGLVGVSVRRRRPMASAAA